MRKKKNKLSSFLLLFIGIFTLLFTVNIDPVINISTSVETLSAPRELEEKEYIYLSDLQYETANNWSYNGWSGHTIQLDKNQEGGSLSLIVNGEKRFFSKGVSVHAKGQVTYNIEEYAEKYPRFIAHIGVDASRGTNGSIWFRITASKDGLTWDRLVDKSPVLTGISNAVDIDINIEGYKYLCIYFDPNGANAADHGTIANARLVSTDFDKNSVAYEGIKNLPYYDEILSSHDAEYNLEHNYRLVLEREFVRKIGYWTIQDKAELEPEYIETLNWLLHDDEILEQLIEVGEVRSSDIFFETLHALYSENKEALASENGYVYQKMLIALAAAYRTDNVASPLTFSTTPREYDVLERYRLVKLLFDTGKFDRIEEFKTYHVELMRFVMQDAISNEELIWLNEYSRTKRNPYDKYSYISYRYNPQYNQPAYRDPANKEKYDTKYLLSQYNVPYGDNVIRYWMAFEYGGICWNISRIGQTINKIKGVPSVGAYQPDHESYLTYRQNQDGIGFWDINYNLFGWGKSSTKWWGGNRYRLLFNWADKSFANQVMSSSNYGTSSGYLLLGQAALNRYDEWQKSLYLNYLANSYTSNEEKLSIYNQALGSLNINLDSFDSIITLYKNMNKTSSEWRDLAERVIDAYTYYPNAMYDILRVIKPYLTGMDRVDIDLREQTALIAGTKATNDDVLQSGPAREIATTLLGRARQELATFSFDGENAGKIIINSAYDAYDFNLSYSIDGGKTYSSKTTSHVLTLTEEEIAKITAENDIKIRMDGTPQIYTIDITKGVVSTSLFANDLENRVIGVTNVYEWRNSETDPWTSYKDAYPDNTGDKTLYVRVGATGTHLASDSVTYTFTLDNQPETRKYVPISHLSIHAVSSQEPSYQGSAAFVIDGNYNTRWHSNWGGSDTQRYITIKLDEPKYVSAVEFVPAGGGNGKIIDGIIWGSLDGENWFELTKQTNLRYTNSADSLEDAITNIKDFAIEDPMKVQYVKIEAKRASNGNWFAARAFNIYEDKTIVNVANFSFDGEKAGQISLEEDYFGQAWNYSIDGGITWKTVHEDNYSLSYEEIEQINENDQIKIRLEGEETEHIIKIKKGAPLVVNPYVNDLENRLIGLTEIDQLEWKIGNGKWTSYQEEEPIVLGTNTLYIRRKATRITTASDVLEYQFTEDNQPDTAKYIPIKHLSIHAYSTQSIDSTRPFYAPNVIDGNINTMWHTDFRYSVLDSEIKPFITIKLDQPKYISALEFVQRKYRSTDPDFIKHLTVLVSMDGENWTEIGKILDCPQDNEWRRIDFATSMEAEYVKLEMDTYGIFASLAMVNLFEDTTKVEVPTGEIRYSTTDLTNQDVIATIEVSEDVTIINNGGEKTYTFTENGEFRFEFENQAGTRGYATAKVDWIDKEAPTAEITYSITELTNQDVIATLVNPSEEITILNNDGLYTHTFTENGEFTFEIQDRAGNVSRIKAVVNNIDKVAPTSEIKYSTTELTNQNVVATLFNSSEQVVILNNNGLNSYTFTENGEFIFEVSDMAGNVSKIKASVNNIDKVAPTAEIIYSMTELTNQDVIATLVNPSEEITILNNDGLYTHTFTENGEFTFEIQDRAGNVSQIKASVNNIDKVLPTAEIKYSTTNLTNQDVVVQLINISEEVTVLNNSGKDTYTFVENGEFTFEIQDRAGNISKIKATVNNIDKIAPTAEIKYSTTDPTNKDVVVQLINISEEVIILNNNGKDTYTFVENGEFTFEIQDKAGNISKIKAIVNNIDRDVPVAEIKYSTTDPTNQDVIVTLVNPSEEITILNNNGKDTYTFTENGEFRFEFENQTGTKGYTTARVNWIDKVAPTAEVSYSTTELTNQDVVVSLVHVSEEVTILNNGGKDTYTFVENGEFVFEIQDKAGNVSKIKATVNNIDKVAPTAEIEYSTTDLVNTNVTATLINASEEITILNNNGLDLYVFTENGEFTFEIQDKAGNVSKIKATVNNIDKVAPTAEIEYSTILPTNGDVRAKLVHISEEVTILNNNGSDIYIFTENGEFTFEIQDKAGNVSKVKATVNNIDKVAPTAEIKYSTTNPTNQDVVAQLINISEEVTILNNQGLDTYTFIKNGEFTFEIQDKAGNVSKIKATVNNIDKVAPTAEIRYSTTDLTNQNVVVMLENISEEVIILNNNGLNVYTFTENGEFTFEIQDKAGNISKIKATVNNIDKVAPTAEIKYSTTNPTNQNVTVQLINVSEKVAILNNNGSDTYVFAANGEFVFELRDQAGNVSKIKATVSNIDKIAPTADIKYSTTDPTNKDVVVTLVNPSEEITILNNNGSDTYTFKENGEFIFEIQDKAGNVSKVKAIVNNIDRNVPTAEVKYSTTNPTNQDVIVTLVNASEEITILNNNGSDTYTFTENGEFRFEFINKKGTKGYTTARVNWIDKVAPTAEIKYSTTDLTNKDVVVTLVNASEEITILNNDGKDIYTFTENGEFTFEIQDKAGNISKIKATVNNIDKVAPSAEIKYSTTDLTNKDVIVTLVNPSEEVTILNNNGSDTYTFTENGEFTFEIQDKAGNISKIKATVNNIDKVAPSAEIKYSTTDPTNKDVVVTLVNASEEITILNNNGSDTYTFTENGEFIFEIQDKAGNVSKIKAIVNNIDRNVPTAEVKYSTTNPTNKDVVVTLVNPSEEITILNNNGSDTYTFTENGEFRFEFVNKTGTKGYTTVRVNWIDKIAPTAEVKYSATDLTNKDVVVQLVNASEEIIILNNNGSDTYTFAENGEFTFEIQDKAGNVSKIKATVNNIDKVAPTAEIKYSITNPTNKDVIATLVNVSEEVNILNNDGKDTYTFIENGEFTFEIQDKAGNTSQIKAMVNNIDKIAPTAEIKYSTTRPTNKDVIVQLVNVSEEITILNNNGSDTYTFIENGEFIFEIQDNVGNVSYIKAIVNNISKNVPIAEIKYHITELTNKDVVVTLVNPSEEITILNNNGSDTYTFTENGEFTFEFENNRGTKGYTTARVNWIDKEAPTTEVKYSTTGLTNKDVVVQLVNPSEEIIILNNNGSDTYTFIENGEFTFEIQDKAGNVGHIKATVNNIDKIAPIATINYSINSVTKNPVVATVVSDEEFVVINNGGSATYTFTENGEFTFEIQDKAGNISKFTAHVDWIEKNIINSKPSNNGNASSSKPSNNGGISTKPNENNSVFKQFVSSGVTISFYDMSSQEIKALHKNDFTLSDYLKNRFPEASEYFELAVQTDTLESNYLTITPVKITIQLNPNKSFSGIYKVDGNTVERLNYNLLSKTEIEVETTGLGYYLISYEDNQVEVKDPVSNETDSELNQEEKSIINWLLVVITLVLGSSGLIVYKTRKN